MSSRAQIPAENKRIGWWPLVFTPFVVWLFLDPWQRHASRLEWGLTVLGVAVFFGLYIVALLHWFNRRVALGAIAGLVILGCIFAPFNQGAAIYIIFAVSYVPFLVEGNIALSVGIIASILAVVGIESWLLHLGWVFGVYSAVYALLLGTGNTYAARQAFAAERATKIAERERIARDLHDVLGHTLSVIVLKSELAGRLLARDPERARREIADVERISREALAEVRQTISSYRQESLKAEFARAKSLLETAGLVVESHTEKTALTPAQENVLALVLREAVTNVVRHAQAETCRLNLQNLDGACRLEIQDDGRGGLHTEGVGLRGMRERIEALGGTLRQDAPESQAGTRLTITLPLAPNSRKQAAATEQPG
jgi:two-component system sensor histidine kinase DesK